MQAWCHKEDNVECERLYHSLGNGYPVRLNCTKELHQDVRVPEGPCGLAELDQFQKVLLEYQLKVLSVDQPHCIIFYGPPAPHVIQSIKVDEHYHGCTSFGGFLSKSYLSVAFDHENLENHPCEGRRCHACERLDCPDRQTARNIDYFAKPAIW